MILSPLPIQKFFANNGRPLDGGLLFTYEAGTSTKVDTYQDETGLSLNTNPVELDFRGECRVWLDPEKSYKFVLSPPGDTDPPTNPIWTVDQIEAGLTLSELTQQFIGKILYPRTAAEITASITPTYYYYPPYDYRRYGAVDDGTTDNTTLISDVNAAFGASFSGVFYVAPNVLYDFNVVMAAIGAARYVLRDESLINAHNTPGFRQKIVGWSDGGDPTAVNDFAVRLSSGHNACFILDNRGTAGSSSANDGIAMVQWTRGEIDEGDPRDLARYEFGRHTSTSWAWVIRRAAPWVARTWEYWEQGEVISATGIYRRTATGYYVSASTGTTGSTEPNWTSGTSSDGGVDWTTVLPNVDSGIFLADQWGQLATNVATQDAVGIYSKSDKYSPGGGQNNFYLEASGVDQSVFIRLRPTSGAEAVTPVPGLRGQSGVGLRFMKSDFTDEYFRLDDTNGYTWEANPAVKTVTITYSASMTPDLKAGESQTITATNNSAFTINAPTNLLTGRRLTIKLRNTSGGALGAATWNAAYKMSAWTNPANGFSRSISFEYDGSNMVQYSQTGVDVPN